MQTICIFRDSGKKHVVTGAAALLASTVPENFRSDIVNPASITQARRPTLSVYGVVVLVFKHVMSVYIMYEERLYIITQYKRSLYLGT